MPGESISTAERVAAALLAGGRLAIGAGLWLAPGASARALGFRELGHDATALARVAASRDLALGVWQLRAIRDRARLRRATTAVAACDAGDALAFALLARSGRVRPGVRGVAAAVPAAALGAWLAARLDP